MEAREALLGADAHVEVGGGSRNIPSSENLLSSCISEVRTLSIQQANMGISGLL